jgi:putative transposase
MPWKKFSVLEARAQFVLVLKNKSESFASVCGRFGISRKSGYKWWQRYRTGGLKALGNVSRRPRHRGKMHRFVWRMRLRKERQEHPRWGAKKLRRLLKRAFPQARRVPAVSTLARWLVELHLVNKRKRRARRGPVLPRRGVHAVKGCNQVWTIDFKGWFRTGDGRRCEPLTVRDLFSRYVLSVALLPNQSDTAVRRALAQVFRRYGLPKVIRVDNGAPFGGKGALGLSRLSVWWLRLGIAVEFVRPAHPEDNGAHEQMHRVFRADVAAPPAPSVAAQKRRIRAWIGCYNHERPHEALGQRVPAQIYWPSNRPMPEQLPKVKYPCAWETRRVRNRGHIKWQGRERFVGRAFVGQLIGLNKVAKGIHEVYLDYHLIGLLYERDLAGMRPASIARHP